MTAFKMQYFENIQQRFIGDIPCAAHIINLAVNDIMTAIKMKPPKSDEIAIYIDEADTLDKEINATEEPEPGKFNFIIINITETILTA
jgi:hypothetical protein